MGRKDAEEFAAEGRVEPEVVVGRVLSKDARLLSRVAAPAEADFALRVSRALCDPERVRRLVEGVA